MSALVVLSGRTYVEARYSSMLIHPDEFEISKKIPSFSVLFGKKT